MNGTVRASAGGVYAVRLDDGRTVEASLRGRLKKDSLRGSRVVIGDRVEVHASDPETWTIDAVHDRASALVRRGRGGREPKVLAANLDRVFAVLSLAEPPTSVTQIDRLLVLGETSGMHPILILNKLDLEGASATADELVSLYSSVGYRVLTTSAASGAGLEALRGLACVGSSAFIGPSGVGKSSLLNALDPSLDLRTGVLSRKTGTGRHTTVGSRLLELECGGLVADTPGFGDVGLWAVDPDEVADCFPEIAQRAGACRFRGCTHLHEPGCAVLEAVARTEIPASRHESYALLRAEAEEPA